MNSLNKIPCMKMATLLDATQKKKRMMGSGHMTGLVFGGVGLLDQRDWYNAILYLGDMI